jgi:DNA mismatch repair protein MLH3
MAAQSHQILPLPPEVQSQIRSSIDIASLSDVVIELVKNSLDAQPRAIHIEVDYLRGGCCVEDDGAGIPAEELSEHGHFGSMYCKWP